MRKRLRRIRTLFQNRPNPRKAIKRWANNPKKLRKRLRRWRAVLVWVSNKRQALLSRGKVAAAKRWKPFRQVAVNRIDRLEERLQARQREVQATQTGCGGPGWPDWGGARSIVQNEARSVAEARGAPLTSAKRPANHRLSIRNPGSDHNEANTYAYAEDYGTWDGAAAAHAIAKALGISGYRTGTYTHYYIQRCGRTFRVQILWQVAGHHDHVHVGIRRV